MPMFFIRLYSFFKKSFFLKDKIILINLIVSLVILVALLFLFMYKFFAFRSGDEQLFLHYNIYFGIDWMGIWYKIFVYPLVGLAVYIINLFLGILFYKKDKFISRLLICSITFCEILIFIAGMCVVWINS